MCGFNSYITRQRYNMRTSELIKELQTLDPNDECVICVSNHPVSDVGRMPWYYDGRVEFIERDHKNIPTKAGYPNHGSKIKIYFDTLEDALIDNPDVELDLSGITYQDKVEVRYMENIEKWKEEGHEFQEWKKTDLLADESRKNFRKLPKISLRTRFTSLLRQLRIID